MPSETPEIAQSIEGDKLYQERAKRAFPLLVRQALAHQPIFYDSLAEELEMPYALNLNFVLGSIGKTVENLSREWNEEIPPIQSLVINKQTELPGDGVFGFLAPNQDVKSLNRKQKRDLVNAVLQKIYFYPRWFDVLDHFSLPRPTSDFTRLVRAASAGRGGGESEAHRNFKEWVATQPRILGFVARKPLKSRQGRKNPPAVPRGTRQFAGQLPSHKWLGYFRPCLCVMANRMEIFAAIAGLEMLKQPCQVTLNSDSQYLVDAITKGWVESWKKKKWWHSRTERVPNRDLWERLLPLCEKHQVEFRWVKGHAGNRENERCDQLAMAALRHPNLPADEGYENKPETDGVRPDMQPGDPCGKCSTPVIKQTSRKKPKGDFYYEFYLWCPKC